MRSDTGQGSNVLLFGDQTDGFYTSIKQISEQSTQDPLLGAFLQDASAVLRREMGFLEPKLRDALGGSFTDLLQLAGRFRNQEDSFGLAHALLVGIARAAKLLQFSQTYPGILSSNSSPVYLAGACGGLLVASALVIADDIQSLYQASLEMIRVTCRLSSLMITRSRAIEDTTDSWGWSIIGVSARDLQQHLDNFHQIHNIQGHRRAKIGVSDLDDGWQTVIGPPSVLRLFFTAYAPVKSLPRQKLRISTLTHALDKLDEEEVEYVVGDSTLLDVPVRSRYILLSLGNSAEYKTPVWRNLLHQIVRDIGTKPLMLRQGLQTLDRLLEPSRLVNLNVIAPTAHLAIVSGFLEQSGRMVRTIHEPTSRLPELGDAIPTERIAIVGVSGRYPASDNLEEFWNIISQGKIIHSKIPSDRFNIDELYDPKTSKHMSLATNYGCFIREPGLFDARFFNISPREAMQIDPAHRLFMMASYEALEMAGYSRGRFAAPDDTRISTFFGQATEDWRDIMHNSGGDAFSLGGLQRSFGPGRVNHHMRWSGPAYSIDSACASGLSSVTLACSSLLSRDCDMAVAGGANIIAGPLTYHALSKAGFLSTTGGCKTYRADADGYCRGEFVGAFVLKRLEDAIADNDNILSVIAGSARNHSGLSSSITHSDSNAQESLMSEVLRKAKVEASDVSYVEMHGTGTQVGDLAEMTAVANTFGNRNRPSTLNVGAIKANIGHAEAGAGSAALLKGVLMLQTGIIPPQAGLPNELNPKFPKLDELGIAIPTQQQPFQAISGTARPNPRSILVNSFDASGGNTCVLLQEPPQHNSVGTGPDPRSRHVVATSAKTAKSHMENKRRLLNYLRANPSINIADVAYTTTSRRLHYPIRSSYAIGSTSDLIEKLQADVESLVQQSEGNTGKTAGSTPPVVFTFTGQGAVYGGMGSDLYKTSPVFREKVDLCARLTKSLGFPSFLELIADSSCKDSSMTTVQTQLAVVTLEVALAAFWISCGVNPSIVMGHSLGEYAALHVSGVLSLADMLSLVGRRAELIEQQCEPRTYSMLAVSADEATVSHILASAPRTSSQIACLNSPITTVVSGKAEDIKELQSMVRAQNLRCTILPLAYGFHSSQLDPVLDGYTRIAQSVPYHTPKIPVASTLLGEVIAASGTFNGAYLAHQARKPVNFVGAVRAVCTTMQDPIWLEMGPTAVCTELVRATIGATKASPSIASSLQAGTSSWSTIASALKMVYEARVDVDWSEFHAPYTKHVRLLALPSYSFDTKNYWRVYEMPKAVATSHPSCNCGAGSGKLSTTTLQRLTSESYGTKTEVTFQSFFSDPGLHDLVSGHRLQGVAISPGAVFADMALTAAKYVMEKSGKGDTTDQLSLKNCSFIRPVVLDESDKQQSIHLSVHSTLSDPEETNSVSSSLFGRTLKGAKIEYAKCLVATADIKGITSVWEGIWPRVKSRCIEVSQAARDGRGHRLSPPLFYALFSHTVDYSDAYRRIKEVSISEDFLEAVAEVELQPLPDGTTFTLSPYWADSVVHLAGFLVNCNPTKPSDVVAMLQSFDACDIVKPMVPKTTYRVYASAGQMKNSSTSVDVWVFHREELIMQFKGLRFHQLPIKTFSRLLGKQKTGSNTISTPEDELVVGSRSEPVQQSVHKSTSAATRRATMMTTTSVTTPGVLTPESSIGERTPQWNMPSATTRTENERTLPSRDRTLTAVLEAIAESTGYETSSLSPKTVLSDLGVDSIMAIQIAMEVQERLGIQIEATSFLEHPTIEAITTAFCDLVESTNIDEPKSCATEESSPVAVLSIVERTATSEAPITQNVNIIGVVLEALAAETGTDIAELDDSTALADLGVDSIMAIQIATAVQDATGIELGAAMFHDYPTIGDLRRSISTETQAESLHDVSEMVPLVDQEHSPRYRPNSTGSWEDVGEDQSLSSAGLIQPTSGPVTATSQVSWQTNPVKEEFTTQATKPLPMDFGHKKDVISENTPIIRPLSSVVQHETTLQNPISKPPVKAPKFKPTIQNNQPHVNIVLMHGRLSSGLTPLFLFPDGTGAASTYIYLKRLRNNRPVYAVESPYLHCPEAFTCGAEQVATLMAEAVLRTQPCGPYLLSGYSGGSILAYETARQLLVAGHKIQGLLLYDMAAPKIRPDAHEDALPKVLVEMMVRLMGGSRNVWLDQTAARKSQLHMRHTVRCVSTYEGKPMPLDRRPARTVITWCKRGVAERLDDKFKQTLANHGISCEPVANFMEDPAIGPFNWTFPPNKPLGPNGWDQMVGPIKCMALDADHFSMIVPPDVDKFHRALEEALVYCTNE